MTCFPDGVSNTTPQSISQADVAYIHISADYEFPEISPQTPLALMFDEKLIKQVGTQIQIFHMPTQGYVHWRCRLVANKKSHLAMLTASNDLSDETRRITVLTWHQWHVG